MKTRSVKVFKFAGLGRYEWWENMGGCFLVRPSFKWHRKENVIRSCWNEGLKEEVGPPDFYFCMLPLALWLQCGVVIASPCLIGDFPIVGLEDKGSKRSPGSRHYYPAAPDRLLQKCATLVKHYEYANTQIYDYALHKLYTSHCHKR